MGTSNSFSGAVLPARHLHRGSTSSFTSHGELSQPIPTIDSDQSLFDEHSPPYTNNSQAILPLGNVFPPSAVLSGDRLLSVVPITSSSLAPARVPLCQYQVQDPQAQQAPLPCMPALGDGQGSCGVLVPLPNVTHMKSMSVNLAGGDPRSTLVRMPLLAASAHAWVQAPVSSEMPPTTSALAQKLNLVTPLHTHTLAHSFPDVTTHDTLPRLRKVSLKIAPLSTHTIMRPLMEALFSAAATTSTARLQQ